MQFILFKARYREWETVAVKNSLEEIKQECIDNWGFPDTILEDDIEFASWLKGIEMKYETV